MDVPYLQKLHHLDKSTDGPHFRCQKGEASTEAAEVTLLRETP